MCCIVTAAQETENIPRPEYPRPQFFRSSWINLNGDWTYTFDFGKSGKQRGLADSKGFEEKITVPFCPESPLSGVNYKDFIDAMWYQREIFVPGDWTGSKILLHFGAVDYQAEVFIDGVSVGKHWGGTSSFHFDIAPYVTTGKSHSLIFLNNEPYYLRLILDQGFYPDGIWTAPSDEALRKDIELSQNAGFNGARLHQKVFEERFHYWADKVGYLTWGESSSWGFDITSDSAARNFLTEWEEIVVRDRNHPSIIAWTPFNETWGGGEHLERLIKNTYSLTKNLDPTRPVNDSSGGFHIQTDIWTEHTYEQDPKKLFDLLSPSLENGVWRRSPKNSIPYGGQPYLIDEYGGIKWIPTSELKYAEDSWGYGTDPKALEEFYERLEALTDVLLGFEHIFGFCYTQLTDIEQEQNGIYNYDRTEKFDMARIKKIISKPKEK